MSIWLIALVCATTVGIAVILLYVFPPRYARAEELAARNEAMLVNLSNGVGDLMKRMTSVELQLKELEGLPAIARAVTRSEQAIAGLTQEISDLAHEVKLAR